MRLISLTDLKSFMEMTGTIAHDQLLSGVIERVSSVIEKFLNRYLPKAVRTVSRDAGKQYYYLPAYPIDESVSLTVTCAGVAQTKNIQFFVRAEDGLIEFQKAAIPVYTNPKEVVINWTGGYAPSGESDTECLDVPDDLKEATLRQSAYTFRRRKDIGVSSVSMPDGSISKNPIDAFLLPEVRSVLQPYRRVSSEY